MNEELGPLEMSVMGLLDGKNSTTVQHIHDELKRAGHDLAYTTVMTVLVRLHEKGLAQRTKVGRSFSYVATKRAQSVTRKIISRIGRTLFRNDRAAPILALLEDEKIGDDELRVLRKAIDEKMRLKK